MNLVTDQEGKPPVLWKWMHGQTQLAWSTDLRTIGLMRNDGTIAAVVGFNGWKPDSVWMHVAFDSAHSLTRKLLRAAFDYPFVKCGKSVVYGFIDKENFEANRLVRKLGFNEIATTPDSIMYQMTADKCRWIKE